MALTTRSVRRSSYVVLALSLLTAPAAARAESPADAQRQTLEQAIASHWQRLLAEEARAKGLSVQNGAPTGTNDAKIELYRNVFQKLLRVPDVLAALHPDVPVDEQVTEADRRFVDRLSGAGAAQVQATSVDAAATNPAAGTPAERSGFTSLLGLAAANNFINADGTAVSVNLSALALYGLRDPNVFSSLSIYRQHSLLRRIGGTVIFGSKIPEKAITGISGLPDAETLFDAFSWDVKVRVLGDRDPRAAKWYPLTVSEGGSVAEISSALLSNSVVPASEAPLVAKALSAATGAELDTIKQRIARSPQLAFKAAGLHLNKDEGKDKYSFGAMFDVGFNAATVLTADAVYSSANDVRLGADKLFAIKQLDLNAAVTTHVGNGVFARNRAVTWKSGASSLTFRNRNSLPIPVKNTWKLFSEFGIPLGDAAQIPISVVYTNDGNALKKAKYVSGNVGITYDFSGLGKLFKS